jgi:hypothetical protein
VKIKSRQKSIPQGSWEFDSSVEKMILIRSTIFLDLNHSLDEIGYRIKERLDRISKIVRNLSRGIDSFVELRRETRVIPTNNVV